MRTPSDACLRSWIEEMGGDPKDVTEKNIRARAGEIIRRNGYTRANPGQADSARWKDRQTL